ncbi:Guanine nucleotide-binding protein subunit alpha [Hypsizygus marmoreus]|uniref:Guanine nucleotide-binding protein subunit alpha n=1 Tax=Hypsizygus marmoreus TaxID=39966 RepID=A0A369J3S2_HYPMA|nr:Guanine nucleotide-binding protein subunit alpha [Hypsizygus marmoreus]
MPKVRTPVVARPTWPPQPPPDESDEARAERVAAEEEAKRVSDSIDRGIVAEREHRKKNPNAKILLLGQAESGKSTVLKNFQLHFSPKAFEAEAEIWRPIIHLNLVRSVNFILNFLASSLPGARDSASRQTLSDSLSGELRRLCIRLAPLREVEASLTKTISGAASFSPSDTPSYNPAKASEVAIRSTSGWRSMLKVRRQSNGFKNVQKTSDANRRTLAACAEDIISLWNDPIVQNVLWEREISLQEQPGFFLDEVTRVTHDSYVPTSSDILRARVTTIGPEEHHINVENNATGNAKEWIIYDVGGSRSQRAAWAQYFDDVNIIIFLAPMSSFNQVLAEDESVNRLTDSLKLWQMICSNKLLASVELILFLNKLDILDAKLKAGVLFSNYVKSYHGQPNETKPVARYLIEVFLALHQQNTPKKRRIHPHLTCAIDTKATSAIIDRIHETVIVKILSSSAIL